MRIAQVAPLHESVPPALYGGTERVVHYLTEELVRLGHEVTLFASGDSRTSAVLEPACPRALRLDPGCVDRLAHHVAQLEQVFRRADDFDLVHFHTDYLHFPVSARQQVPHVTTLHGRLDLPDLPALYRLFDREPLVSISNAQRAPLPWVDWRATVYHGLPVEPIRPGEGRGGYLAFLGRISPEKRVDRAIEIARRSGWRLKVAAKIDAADRAYYAREIAGRMRQPHVDYLGEIGEAERVQFLGDAAALLFPIDWPEPFGLVMIEAMACGTPVIAYAHGSVPEIVEPGVNGFVCRDLDQAVAAVQALPTLSRAACRAAFERRFSAARMADDYLRVYRDVIARPRAAPAAGHLALWSARASEVTAGEPAPAPAPAPRPALLGEAEAG